MPFTPEQIIDIFSYHAPDAEAQAHYASIRDAAQAFALVLVEHTPSSPDQSAAIRKLRECVMFANAAVALKGKF